MKSILFLAFFFSLIFLQPAIAADVFWILRVAPGINPSTEKEWSRFPNQQTLSSKILQRLFPPTAIPHWDHVQLVEIRKTSFPNAEGRTLEFANGAAFQFLNVQRHEDCYTATLRFTWHGKLLWQTRILLARNAPLVFIPAHQNPPWFFLLLIR